MPDLTDGSGIKFISNDPSVYLAKNFPDKFAEGLDIDTVPIVDAQIIGQDESLLLCFLQD